MIDVSEGDYRIPVGGPFFQQMALRTGVPGLHDFQIQAITATLRGQDSFLVVPTGGGKSLCYIIPSLVLPGLVVVISPLIALMRDQQRQLENMNVASLSFDSLMSVEEKKEARRRLVNREINVLYISPERLALPGFRELLRDLPIALVAIDEAHCVQQWGQGFRPEYLRLGAYIDELGSAPRMALTATVTSRERLEVMQSLRMRNPQVILKSALRQNLDLVIHRHETVDLQKKRMVQSLVDIPDQGIIYAATRRNVEDVFHLLRGAKRLDVSYYHGGMHGEARHRAQEAFLEGRSKLMVATKAFGMGINLPHVRFIAHANMPCSIESYVQEVGRAGRDGAYARCDLHYGPKDYFLQKFMIDKSYPSAEDLKKAWNALESILGASGSCQEESIASALVETAGIPFDIARSVLDFLLREQAVQMVETFGDYESPLPKTYLTIGTAESSLNRLLQALSEQVAWKFDKLNAMHRLVKDGSNLRGSIEGYFL